LIWTLVGALVLLAVPAVDRAERQAPFGFAMVLLATTLAVRLVFVGVEASAAERYTPWALIWFFALGWAASRAASWPRRLLVTGVAAAAVSGFFAQPDRELLIVIGMALLIWVSTVRVPRWLGRALAMLASSSLYIYLTHWQVYPHLEDRFPVLAVLASIAVGICYRLLVTVGLRDVVRRLSLFGDALPTDVISRSGRRGVPDLRSVDSAR
jgi:fucose 4-O-acetylase-like acetyltransferase